MFTANIRKEEFGQDNAIFFYWYEMNVTKSFIQKYSCELIVYN